MTRRSPDKHNREYLKTPNSTKRSYHKYLIISAGVLLLAIGKIARLDSYVLQTTPTESRLEKITQEDESKEDTIQKITFSDAKKSPALRNIYVDELKKRINIPPYIKQVVYTPIIVGNPNIRDNQRASITMKTDCVQENNNIYTIIRITDDAFNAYDNESELMNLLVDHEFRHSEFLIKGIPMEIPTAYGAETVNDLKRIMQKDNLERKLFLEIDAYSNQIANFRKYPDLGAAYKQDVIAVYQAHIDHLTDVPQTPFITYLRTICQEHIANLE